MSNLASNKFDYPFFDKITIVILSYNRRKSLIRTLRYWSKINVKIIIFDGSQTALDDDCLMENNIEYIHQPASFYERFLNSKNYLKTEFVIMCADDEFYLPSALSSCIKFLVNNKTFSSCGGCALGFFKNAKNDVLGKKVYPKLINYTLKSDTALLRVHSHFSNYRMSHYWSVIRTNTWKLVCQYVFENEYKFYAAHELQIEFLLSISGKSKIIPELMWMRNCENLQIQGTNAFCEPSYTIHEWWIDHQKEKEDFLKKMETAANKITSDKNSIFTKDIISKIFENYLQWDLSQKSFRFRFSHKVPYKLKAIIKSLFKFNHNKKTNFVDIVEEARILENMGVKVNYKELKRLVFDYIK